MTSFEYLFVLVSIIIGLAIAHLLSSSARLLQRRHRMRAHATSLCWMAFMFLANIQIWWIGFDRRNEQDWQFFPFLLYLLIPITAFVLSYLVVPDLDDDAIDLRRNFEDNRRWFFGLLGALPLISLAEQALRGHLAGFDLDVAFRLGIMVGALAAWTIRDARFHFAYAAFSLATLCAYVLLLFLRLD